MALALVIYLTGSADAQSVQARDVAGAFGQSYPEANRLLGAVEANLAAVYGSLRGSSGGQLPADLHARLVGTFERPAATSTGGLGVTGRIDEVIGGARALHREILDIYTAPDVADRRVMAELAIDAYLADSQRALPTRPKAASVLTGGETDPDDHQAHAAEAHAGHQMGMPEATAFAGLNPQVNRLLWAQQWLEIAAFEPLVRPANSGGQAEGMRGVVERFHARIADPSDPRLTVMPTTVAISPEMTTRHPRAAIILDNLHMLEMALANELSTGSATDIAARLERVVAGFMDAEYLALSEADWRAQSLRRSVFLQGGPAIGRMDRMDRNVGSPGDHLVRGGTPTIMPAQ